MNKGGKVRVSRVEFPQWPKIKNREGTIYYLDKVKIVVKFKGLKSDDSFRETFIQADIIEKKVKLEVKEGKQWVKVGKEYFK
jgi:arginine/lysine/ornithine decarboxylase